VVRRWLLIAGLVVVLALGLVLRFGKVEIAEGTEAPLYIIAYMAAGVLISPYLEPDYPEGLALEIWDDKQLAGVPVAIDADERGRIWVAESPRMDRGVSDNRWKPYWLLDDLAAKTVADRVAYIEKWAAKGGDTLDWFTDTADRLRVVEDADGDGRADRSRVAAEFGGIATGIGAGVLTHAGDVFYTNIPDLWALRGASADPGAALAREGPASSRAPERLATGFGVRTSLSGHDLHGLTLGPEGRIYFSIGDRGYDITTREGRHLSDPLDAGRGAVFRVWPDGSGLEVFATGLRNPQKLAFDDYGNLFTCDNNGDGGDKARVVYVAEGGDSGWSQAYQTLEGDYLRGPWNAEKHWELQHPNQPAWILPPIAHVGNGPAGFGHYPGTGLPERYAGHFFLADYAYSALDSGIWSFAVKPAGAGFALDDLHKFAWGVLATDFAFGPDGRFTVSRFVQYPSNEQQLYAGRHEVARGDVRVAEVERLLRDGLSGRSSEELRKWLSHADRRVRQRAQAELVRTRRADLLMGIARDEGAPAAARVHALFGLSALGEAEIESLGWSDFAWAEGGDSRLLAVALRSAGEAGCTWLADAMLPFLRHADTAVRAAAAQGLGALRARIAIPALFEVLSANADADVFLRHAAVYALARIGDLDAVLARADDPSAAVRMGTLLVLRRARDARVARFLEDADPRLVLEAARAIHDLRIEAALPALAALASESALPLESHDAQTSAALHRRALDANLMLGGADSAERLARYAGLRSHPIEMRRAALAALEAFSAPGPREPVNGYFRAIPERDAAEILPVLDALLPALLRGELAAEAFRVAARYDRVPLPDGELAVNASRFWLADEVRVASLRSLAQRAQPGKLGPVVEAALGAALRSTTPVLRAEARDALARLEPARALAELRALDWRVGWRAPAAERQRSLATLAKLSDPGVDEMLAARLDELSAGALAPELALDLLELARARDSATLHERVARYESKLSPSDPLAAYRVALAGGDPLRGKSIFEGNGDCMRCHVVGGHGGKVGPDLSEVGAKGASYLLESLVEPQAQLAAGYRSVSVTTQSGESFSGDLEEETPELLRLRSQSGLREIRRNEIREQSGPASAMPPLGRVLPLRDLRDVIAFLSEKQ
jgi:quinoprotein glucose dehydrogenase